MYPRKIGHMGLTVKDIEKSVEWYCRVFGFQLLTPVAEVVLEGDSLRSVSGREMLGEDVRRFKIARVCDGGGTAIEFFQYIEIEGGVPNRPIDPRSPGWAHICITDEDIEGLMDRVVAHGGTRTSGIIGEGEGTPYRCGYCRDPEGTVIELASHSSERMYANL